MKDHCSRFTATLAHTFRGDGRAARREFIGYVVLSQVPVALADWLGGAFAPPPADQWLNLIVQALILAPLPALIVRRLHDIGISGRWSWAILPLAFRAVLLTALGTAAGDSVREPVESALSWVDWAFFLPAFVLYLTLLALPAQPRAERFGPDPRIQKNQKQTAGVGEPTPAA